jgi:hypothetical protein
MLVDVVLMPSSCTSFVATVPARTIFSVSRDQPEVTSRKSPVTTPCVASNVATPGFALVNADIVLDAP